MEYYDVDYRTTTVLEGLRLRWQVEIRSPGAFEDEELLLTSKSFENGADFNVIKAFKPRGQKESRLEANKVREPAGLSDLQRAQLQ